MTPRGSYWGALETHRRETEEHSHRLAKRIGELGTGSSLLASVIAVAETAIGQALALGKTPLDLLRGRG